MKLSLSKKYNRKIINAIAEFNLIEEDDHILVAFSGGYDSAFLLYSLKTLQNHLSINYKISAITIDISFSAIDYSQAKSFTKSLNLPYYIKETNIAKIISKKEDSNPCATCSYFRKGAITEFIKEKDYKFDKIAYGHHLNDVIETFLMSIIYSGQIKTFEAKNVLTEAKAEVIRPLVNLKGNEINEFMSNLDYKAVDNKCPYATNSKRKKIKNFINNLENRKQIIHNLSAAIREDSLISLWSEKENRDKLQQKVYELWQSK